MRAIENFFRRWKGVSKEEDKLHVARMTWDRIGSMLDANGTATFSAVEITSGLPDELKDWDYLKRIYPPLIVSIHSKISTLHSRFGRVARVISGTRYVEATMEDPSDITPKVVEGTVDVDNEIPFATEFPNPLEFTRKLSIFLKHQHEKSQPIM